MPPAIHLGVLVQVMWTADTADGNPITIQGKREMLIKGIRKLNQVLLQFLR